MRKKDLPLEVLKILEKYVSIHGEQYIRIEEDDSMLKLIDCESESDFHFIIQQYKDSKFLIQYKPYTKINVDSSRAWISINELNGQFQNWINLLEEYSKVKSIFDDPILKSFEEEYFSDFEILEEDKEKPLENEKLLLLDSFLENLVSGLESHKTDNNKNKIEEIQSSIILLQENLTTNTRQEITEKISKIFAKIKKLGIKYIKEFITEGKNQLMSEGIKFLIENTPKLIDEISKNLH